MVPTAGPLDSSEWPIWRKVGRMVQSRYYPLPINTNLEDHALELTISPNKSVLLLLGRSDDMGLL
jgi:hypothetical protein